MSFIINDPYRDIGILLENKITTDRYLWHVSEPNLTGEDGNELKNERRNSIWKEGIQFYHTNAVFAHNGIKLITEMYPIWMDSMEFKLSFKNYDKMLTRHRKLGWLNSYDFWRIDTHSYTGDWYVDPFMERDSSHYETKSYNWNYVCTPDPIPAHALTLFNFDVKLIMGKCMDENLDLYEDQIHWDGLFPVIQSY